MLYFFLVWKHPCLSSLFALGFFPLFSLLEKQILQFAGCGWHLPEDLHGHRHQHSGSLRYLFVQGSVHICPPEREFRPHLSSEEPWTSFLHLDYTAQMPISFTSRQEDSGPRGVQSPNFISFSLQSQDFFFPVELLLLALRYMACQICLNDFFVPIITRRKLTGSV